MMTLLAAGTTLADAVDALTANLDGLLLKIRTGSPPATLASAATGTLLVTLELGDPSFAAADANGMAESETIDPELASATGTLGYFRIESGGGTAILQGLVGQSFDLTDWIKTSDTEATATLPTGHGLTSGDGFTVLWSGGGRVNAAATITGDSVTFTRGLGDAFPATGTLVIFAGQGDILVDSLGVVESQTSFVMDSLFLAVVGS